MGVLLFVWGALTEHKQARTHTHIHTRSLLVHIAFFTAQTCTVNAYHSDVIVDAALLLLWLFKGKLAITHTHTYGRSLSNICVC